MAVWQGGSLHDSGCAVQLTSLHSCADSSCDMLASNTGGHFPLQALLTRFSDYYDLELKFKEAKGF